MVANARIPIRAGFFMPKRFLILLMLTLSLTVAGTPGISFAKGAHQLIARRGNDTGGGTSLSEAVQQVQRETGGRVLSADTINQDGRLVHRIKVLTSSGQVRVMTIDAR